MQHVALVLDGFVHGDGVAIQLGGAKNQNPASAAAKLRNYVIDNGAQLVPVAADGNVSNGGYGLLLAVTDLCVWGGEGRQVSEWNGKG